jgi:membrane protein implicated in regulation of membrane protease activity
MPAQDPLSLFFLGCALFSALFLAATVILGAGHGHGGHIGAHTTGHMAGHAAGHVTGHAGHAAGHAASHAASHAGHTAAHHSAGHAAHTAHTANGGQAEAGDVAPAPGPWAVAQGLLLGALNINGLLIFLLVFGTLGYLLHTGGTPLLLVLLLAALVGVIGAVIVNAALAKLFFENEAGELTERSSQIEGRLATVSIAIKPGGIGEIIFTGEAGARQSMGARAEDRSAAIAVGDEVVVTSVENGIATVQPWSQLLEEAKARLLSDPARNQAAPPAN